LWNNWGPRKKKKGEIQTKKTLGRKDNDGQVNFFRRGINCRWGELTKREKRRENGTIGGSVGWGSMPVQKKSVESENDFTVRRMRGGGEGGGCGEKVRSARDANGLKKDIKKTPP